MPTTKFQLSFPGCRACLAKPCERLRFGRVFAGKFLFVHKRYCPAESWECPFVAADPGEMRFLAANTPFIDLLGCVEDIVEQLSIQEVISIRQEQFVTGYGDVEGRMRFLEALWNAAALTVIRVPDNFMADRGLAQWLLANETLDCQFEQTRQDDSAGAAVTDSMAGQQEEQTTSSGKPPVKKGSFHIRLNIDPNDKDAQGDAFTMFSTDQAKSYNKVLTVKDDQVPGDSYTDLSYTNLDTSLSYSLKIELGSGGQSYLLIENKPYGELHG